MGPPGSRKTTLGLQFPDVHVLDCDNNLDGPERFLRQAKFPLSYTYDSIRYKSDGNQRDVEECYSEVCDKLSIFKVDSRYQKRKVVFLDSLSHVNEFIIRHVLKGQGRGLVMEARDWGPFKSLAYSLLVARLEETGKTILCSCHEIKVYGKSSKEDMMNPPVESYDPFFQGKVGETLGAFFTDVWRSEVRLGEGGKLQTWLRCFPGPKFDILKNSVGINEELNVTEGFKVLEPFLKGRI